MIEKDTKLKTLISHIHGVNKRVIIEYAGVGCNAVIQQDHWFSGIVKYSEEPTLVVGQLYNNFLRDSWFPQTQFVKGEYFEALENGTEVPGNWTTGITHTLIKGKKYKCLDILVPPNNDYPISMGMHVLGTKLFKAVMETELGSPAALGYVPDGIQTDDLGNDFPFRWAFFFKPAIVKDMHFPHSCPKCGAPAYVGFTNIDCSKKCK